MTGRELFEQLEEMGLADVPLVTNPFDPDAEEDCYIEIDAICGWEEKPWGAVFLETIH